MSSIVEKRKNPKKKKEIKSEIKRKITNDMIKKLKGVKVLTKEQLLLFYSGLITGEIKDRFGLEASTDIKLKAAEKLNIMLDNESASKASVEVNITIDDYSSKKLDQLDANLNEEDEI